MNSLEPLRIQQVNLNNLSYTKIKDEKNKNKKIIYIKYENNKPLVFQCPPLSNENLPKKITNEYFEIEIPLITQENSKQDKLVEFIQALDKKIRNDAKINAKIWFGENEQTFTQKNLIKESDNYEFGVIKVKIIKTPSFETLLLLDNRKRISIKDIPSNSWIKMLLEVYSVVINTDTKKFYLFLRPIALSFKEKIGMKYNYKFLEDSASSEEDIPDSDVNNIFLKQKNINTDKNETTSQINIHNLSNLLKVNTSSKFSSDKEESDSSNSSDTEESPSYKNNKKVFHTEEKILPEKILPEKILPENLSDSEEKVSHSEKILPEKLSDSEEKISHSEEKISHSEEKVLPEKLSDSEEEIVVNLVPTNLTFNNLNKITLTSSTTTDSELKKKDSDSNDESILLSNKITNAINN
jgi:hypothetical protein